MLDQLPTELIVSVYEWLRMKDMGRLSMCCKSLHAIVQKDWLYNKYMEHKYIEHKYKQSYIRRDEIYLWLVEKSQYFKRFYRLYPDNLMRNFNDILRYVCEKGNIDLIQWLGQNVSSKFIQNNTLDCIVVCYPIDVAEAFIKSFPLTKDRYSIYTDFILCCDDERLGLLKIMLETNPWIDLHKIKREAIEYATDKTKVIAWLESLP